MAIGEWHEFADGSRFQETLHGPNVERECVDCGGQCYSIPDYPDPRCERCSIVLHGAVNVVDRLAYRKRSPKVSREEI